MTRASCNIALWRVYKCMHAVMEGFADSAAGFIQADAFPDASHGITEYRFYPLTTRNLFNDR